MEDGEKESEGRYKAVFILSGTYTTIIYHQTFLSVKFFYSKVSKAEPCINCPHPFLASCITQVGRVGLESYRNCIFNGCLH